MQSSASLTRLVPAVLKSPASIELLEHRVVEEIQRRCPSVKRVGIARSSDRGITSTLPRLRISMKPNNGEI